MQWKDAMNTLKSSKPATTLNGSQFHMGVIITGHHALADDNNPTPSSAPPAICRSACDGHEVSGAIKQASGGCELCVKQHSFAAPPLYKPLLS